ncbi:MAG: hypothetical protein E6J45_00855 [Chloroflexi bacterium]|nr:MAG: hypothetical protein E6J45_00855 [Chloroflexota bacterium]
MAGSVIHEGRPEWAHAGAFTARLDALLRTHAEQFRELDLRAAERRVRETRARAPALRREAQQVPRRSRQLALPIRSSRRR